MFGKGAARRYSISSWSEEAGRLRCCERCRASRSRPPLEAACPVQIGTGNVARKGRVEEGCPRRFPSYRAERFSRRSMSRLIRPPSEIRPGVTVSASRPASKWHLQKPQVRRSDKGDRNSGTPVLRIHRRLWNAGRWGMVFQGAEYLPATASCVNGIVEPAQDGVSVV